jgi:diguanylate cyclase (GGDEF)-like protein
MPDQESLDSTADAAETASRNARMAGRAATETRELARLAALAAAEVASRAREATAVSVASLASTTAKVAAGAAAAVASEAVARAFEAAVSAVQTLEAVAARLPADADKEEARLAAASVAAAVADEVLAQAAATTDAAVTVARAVTAAAENAALAATAAAEIVEREARSSAAAGGVVAGAVAATAAAVEGAVESAARVAELTARLRLVAAFRDDLTDLGNRAFLRDRLDQARVRAVRNQTHFAVVSIDLDNFKDLNEGLGHEGGDEILVEVARRLLGCLRTSDTACRSGGDAFHVVFDGIRDPAEAGSLIERLEAAIRVPFAAAGTLVRVTASAGVITDDGTAASDEVIRDADTAMYQAKANGKNRHDMHLPDMRAAVIRRATLAAELERAVADGQLRLCYQPMFAIATGAVVGVEALLRWQHPTRGLVGPGHFLDVAESLRLMTPIGDWVMATAIAQAASWHNRMNSRLPDTWVNVSSQQLGKGRIVSLVAEALAGTGLPAENLGVEITERHLIGEVDDVQADLVALSNLGVRLAVDDFGTGFGSFDYLRRFPVNEIKIDVSFIGGLGTDRTDTAVTSSIVALGRSLDLVVVAEGVETQDQYDRLRGLGCHLVQGYLLGRPVPPEDIDLLLAG